MDLETRILNNTLERFGNPVIGNQIKGDSKGIRVQKISKLASILGRDQE